MIQTRKDAAAGSVVSSRIPASAAVAAGVVGILAASAWLIPDAKPRLVAIAPANADQDGVWLSPIEPDGKIGARHSAAMGNQAEPGHARLIMPATLVMPMSTGWPEQNFSESARLVQAAPRAATRAIVAEAMSSARKPATSGERIMPLPRPLDIAAAASSAPTQTPMAAQEASAQPGLLGRVVYEPLTQAGNLVSSAAGMVGAAGTWTVSRATSLLPRW